MTFSPLQPHYLKWGLIMAASISLVAILAIATQTSTDSMAMQSYWLLNIGLLGLAFQAYKKENQGYLTFGKGFGLGAMTALVGGLLTGIIYYFYLSLFNPEFVTEPEPLRMGIIKEAFSKGTNVTSPLWLSIGYALKVVISGILISLIMAVVMKKNPDED